MGSIPAHAKRDLEVFRGADARHDRSFDHSNIPKIYIRCSLNRFQQSISIWQFHLLPLHRRLSYPIAALRNEAMLRVQMNVSRSLLMFTRSC